MKCLDLISNSLHRWLFCYKCTVPSTMHLHSLHSPAWFPVWTPTNPYTYIPVFPSTSSIPHVGHLSAVHCPHHHVHIFPCFPVFPAFSCISCISLHGSLHESPPLLCTNIPGTPCIHSIACVGDLFTLRVQSLYLHSLHFPVCFPVCSFVHSLHSLNGFNYLHEWPSYTKGTFPIYLHTLHFSAQVPIAIMYLQSLHFPVWFPVCSYVHSLHSLNGFNYLNGWPSCTKGTFPIYLPTLHFSAQVPITSMYLQFLCSLPWVTFMY